MGRLRGGEAPPLLTALAPLNQSPSPWPVRGEAGKAT